MSKNGFMIMNWMVAKKGLSGNELVCYAFLYHETDGGKQVYVGGYEGIAKAIGSTFPTAYNLLRKMKDRGLVSYDVVGQISVKPEF